MLHNKTRVDRSGEKLTEISLASLEKNEKVTELNLSNNLLRAVPEALPSVFPNIVVFKLDKNHFTDVPKFVMVRLLAHQLSSLEKSHIFPNWGLIFSLFCFSLISLAMSSQFACFLPFPSP